MNKTRFQYTHKIMVQVFKHKIKPSCDKKKIILTTLSLKDDFSVSETGGLEEKI